MTIARRLGVLRLDAAVFEEIEADTGATGQACLVVIVGQPRGRHRHRAAVRSHGAGARDGRSRRRVAHVGRRHLRAGRPRAAAQPQTRTDMGELLRVIGFSHAPNFVSPLAVVPVGGRAGGPWSRSGCSPPWCIGVRQALDYTSTFRAFAVVFIGWLIFVGQSIRPPAAAVANARFRHAPSAPVFTAPGELGHPRHSRIEHRAQVRLYPCRRARR